MKVFHVSPPTLLLTALLSSLSFCLRAQTDDQAIRALVARLDAGEKPPYTDNAVFWSGAFPRPTLRNKPDTEATQIREKMDKERHNQSIKSTIERLVIAQSGDVAYEYGESDMRYDDPQNQTHAWRAGYLRAWRKVGGQWKLDAFFARPLDTAVTAYKK
jgi:ketosteroid isomerase-like protein